MVSVRFRIMVSTRHKVKFKVKVSIIVWLS